MSAPTKNIPVLEPPSDGDRNRGGEILALYWSMAGIIIVVMVMRLASRWRLRQIGMDDWVMLLTAILYIASCIATTFAVHYGDGRHSYYLSLKSRQSAVKIGEYIAQPFAIMGLATGKVSVGFLILRIIGPSTTFRRWTIYVIMPLTLMVSVVSIALLFAQCDPPRALWEGPQAVPNADCWDPGIFTDFGVFQGSFNAAVDVILAVLPLTFVWNLQLPVRKKIYLSVLLGSGFLAAVCGAVKSSYLITLEKRVDLLWNTYDLAAWTAAENFVIIVCGSIPTLKPVRDLFFRFLFYITRGRVGRPSPRSSRSSSIFLKKVPTKKSMLWSKKVPWANRATWDGGTGGANEYGATTVTCDRRMSGGSRRWWFGRRAIGVETEWEVSRGSRHARGSGQRGRWGSSGGTMVERSTSGEAAVVRDGDVERGPGEAADEWPQGTRDMRGGSIV